MRSIADERAAVVAEALSWLGTPWHHQARSKGVGVDCANLVIAAYHDAGLIDDIQPGNYPRDWHIHKDEERFLAFVPSFAVEIAEAQAQPGDLVLFRIGRVFSHGAIVTGWPQGVHAYVKARQVVLCDLDVGLIGGARKYFTHKAWLAERVA
jgi:NlpC/P60 family putative phage cell wall peptidase